jgi:hypothetical protein
MLERDWGIKRQVFIKIMPVLGSIILFSSWVFQQTLLDEANSTLQRISNAQSVFQTYQSNNALFNALTKTVENHGELVDYIRRVQIYNYELGLRELEALLDDEAKATIRSPARPFSGTSDPATRMHITQERINAIQGRLVQKREEVNGRKVVLNTTFLLLYAIGSVTILTGSALDAVQSTRVSEDQNSTNRRSHP